MKRYIKSSTTKQLLELIQMYLDYAVDDKKVQFDKFLDRISYFTSDTAWEGTVQSCKEGMYFQLENYGIAVFSAFVSSKDKKVIRKPRNIEFNQAYEVSGRDYEIDKILYRHA